MDTHSSLTSISLVLDSVPEVSNTSVGHLLPLLHLVSVTVSPRNESLALKCT